MSLGVEFVENPDWGANCTRIDVHLHRLHDAQREIDKSLRRFNVLACGRRYGKSLYCGDKIIEGAIEGGPCAWFAPNYKYMRSALRGIAEACWPIKSAFRLSDPPRLELITGGSIDFWSLDDENAGRSNAYKRVVVDEAAMVKKLKYCWEATIRPTLSDLQGDAFFPSTPQGYDYFHDLWELGQNPEELEWASWQHPTLRNPYIAPSEIDAARGTLDARYFAQEYEASFETFVGRVFYGFKRSENVRNDLEDIGGELGIGMDFNVNPMAAAVFVKAADQIHYLDNIVIANSGTEEMCQEIERRYVGESASTIGEVVAKGRTAPEITIYPDATCRARKTSSGPGETDLAILRRHGFRVRAPNANPLVEDRINEMNAMLCNANGERRAFFHPRCQHIIKSVDQLSRKEGTSIIDKSTGLEHMADAMSYPVHVLFPIRGGGSIKLSVAYA